MKSNPTFVQTPWLNIAAQFAVLGAAVCYFSFVTADPDLWGHIRFGEDLWKAKGLVRTDPYSFTAYGQPWINHEWLSELIFYFVYYYFGDAGLLFGKLGIGLAVVLVVGRLCTFRKRNTIIYAVVMITGVMIMSPGFMIRPQVFSFLLFTFYLYVLHLYFAQNSNRLFLLPCLMLFWVNLHGGFLMGLALLFTVVVWKSLSRIILNDKGSRLGCLWFWFFMTCVVTLFNPYGYELLMFLYKTLSLPRQISEWQPIRILDTSYLHFKLMALLFFILFFKRGNRGGWEASVVGMTLIASVLHQRHSPFFAIAIVPHLVHRLSILTEDMQYRFPHLVLSKISKSVIMVVLVLLAGYQVYCGVFKYHLAHFRIIVNPESYPVAAVEYLKINNLSGRLLLPMEWGEYVIWKLYPACRVSIDGRFRTVYPESVIQDHFVHEQNVGKWKVLLEKYPADILLASQKNFFQNLIKNSESWVYVYSDPTAIVFLRNNENNNEILQRFKSGRLARPAPPSIYFP